MLNGLQTKCLLVIVFKRISTPLSSMTNHVMYNVMHATTTAIRPTTCSNM